MAPSEARELLIRGGESLYGPNWQSPLARGLGINLRTMQRWATGDSGAPPDAVLARLAEHCSERAAIIDQVRVGIVAALGSQEGRA